MLLLTAEGMEPRLFGLDFQLLADSCLMIVAIFVLFFVMSYFLFEPAKKFLKARQDRIREELDGAAKNLKEAEELKSLYEAKLRDVDKEAEEILRDAHARALQSEREVVEEAKAEAARIRQHAHNEAELEKQKVADEVKKEMVVLASMIAGKVVSASIDPTVQDRLVDEALKEIGTSTWQS